MIAENLKPIPRVEDGVSALIEQAKTKLFQRYRDCENCVRRSPGKAIGAAMVAGYLIDRLPVRSLLVSQIRLMAALAPPTLVAFGAAKLCEFLQSQVRNKGRLSESAAPAIDI